MDPVEDAKDAKEYNAQHMSIEERKREWQIEKDLFGPILVIQGQGHPGFLHKAVIELFFGKGASWWSMLNETS